MKSPDDVEAALERLREAAGDYVRNESGMMDNIATLIGDWPIIERHIEALTTKIERLRVEARIQDDVYLHTRVGLSNRARQLEAALRELLFSSSEPLSEWQIALIQKALAETEAKP